MASSIGLATIILVGIGAGFPNPGVFTEVDYAQGPSSGSGSPRKAIILGNKTTAGSATADTIVYGPDTSTSCQTESDVINLFGPGSQLHRAFLRFTAVNKVTSLYFLAVAESAGAAATTTQTIATTATSNGTLRVWVVDQFVDTPITVGDTASVVATNVCNSVNAQLSWPVSAAPAAGVITYTAKNKGPEGNWIQIQALILQPTSLIGTTTTLTANTFMSGGTTADNVTNALATIASASYYYTMVCDSDATNIGRAISQVNSSALPTNNGGVRQDVFAGCSDTLANGITLAIGLNATRGEIAINAGTNYTPIDTAANNMALYALLENSGNRPVGRNNFSNFPVNDTDTASWKLIAGRAGSAGGLTSVQITSALNNGLTPFAVTQSGSLKLVKRITTRSLNGSTPDYRIRDAHKRTICDFFADDLSAVTNNQFGGKDLLDDQKQGGVAIPSQATTPAIWGGAIATLVNKYADFGLLQNKDQINANTIVQREVTPRTRMSALIPLQTVDIADQFASLVQQVA